MLDDGLTRDYKKGAFSKQRVEMTAAASNVTVTIHKAKGDYAGKPTARGYLVTAHEASQPTAVELGGKAMTQYTTLEEVSGVWSGLAE